jgi:hypothetical protein
VNKYKIEFLLLKEEDTKCNCMTTLKNLLSLDGDVAFFLLLCHEAAGGLSASARISITG